MGVKKGKQKIYKRERLKIVNTPKELVNKAKELKHKYSTNDPFKIAKVLGIHIMFRDDFKSLYGMYTYMLKNRFIMINSNISENKQKIVCAHELGHDLFHRDIAEKQVLQEFVLYDMQMRTEYEANVFAANLLIDDEDLFDYIAKGYDSMQIANALDCDVNLIALKTNSLITEGYKLNSQHYDSKFLRK